MGIKIVSIDGVPYKKEAQNRQNNNNQQLQQNLENQQQPPQQSIRPTENLNQSRPTSHQPIQQKQQCVKKVIDKQNFIVSIQYNVILKKIVLVFTLIFGQHVEFELGQKIQNFFETKQINYEVKFGWQSYNFSGQRIYVVEVDNKILSNATDLQQLKNDTTSKVNTIQYIYPALPLIQLKYVKQIFLNAQKPLPEIQCQQYCGQLPSFLNLYQIKLIKEIIQKSYQTNLLYLPPGFGKSVIALYVSLYFKRPVVVLAPQMLHLHWISQINHFVNQFEDNQNLYPYKKLTDGLFSQINYKNHRLVLNHKEYRFCYTKYSVFKEKTFKNFIIVTTLTELLKIQDASELDLAETYLIMDESHEYREVSAQKTQNMMSVSKQVRFKLLLTATPVVNQVSDIYLLLWLNGFPLSAKEFANRYTRMENTGKYMKFIGLQHEMELRWYFQKFLVQLSKQEVEKVKSRISQGSGGGEQLPKLPQIKRYICSFASVNGQNTAIDDPLTNCSVQYKKASERKQNVTFDILRQFAQKNIQFIVYFVNLTNAEYFKHFPNSRVITGQVPGQERAQIVKEFQEGKFQALFATIDSICTGLDVTAAKTIFWLQMEWTMAMFEQAEGRIRRINSSYDTVYSIVLTDQNYWDQRVRNIVSFKKTLGDWMCHSDTLDGVENSVNSAQYNSDFRFEQLTSLDQII